MGSGRALVATAWGLVALTVLGTLGPPVQAQPGEVKPSKEWTGSLEDENLRKDVPVCVTSAKSLEKLWQLWKIPGKVPDVDFTKEIVVVLTAKGSRVRLSATLEGNGNLRVMGLETRDLRPGFRYVLAAVSREGVKKVNGQELAKE